MPAEEVDVPEYIILEDSTDFSVNYLLLDAVLLIIHGQPGLIF